jgi:4-amino-4-deoxy-L-arabinose transferase-like glycosyltransferase
MEVRPSREIAWFLLAIALLFRLRHFLVNRSLWLDEAALSLNIVHRSFEGLWQPLNYGQGAPVVFLMLQKSAVDLLGTSEYALRLLPLLASVVSILLFYKLASKTVSMAAVPVALGLFAVSPTLIYYSSEAKQYSSDVAVALLLFYLIVMGHESEWKPLYVVVVGLVGSMSVWVSHSSVFVLAGTGAAMLIGLAAHKQWPELRRLSAAFIMCAASFIACYVIVLRKLAHDPFLLGYWQRSFMPFPPRTLTDFKWFVDSFFDFFHLSAGLRFAGLAALVFVLGVVSMFKRSWELLFLLVSPAIATIAASGLHKYPFFGRLTLFLVPMVLLLMAEGAESIVQAVRDRLPVAGTVLLGLLFLDTGLYSVYHFAKPFVESSRPGVMRPEELRPVLAYLRTHEQPGDLVYVFFFGTRAFEYYAERDGLPRGNVKMGTASGDDPRDYESDLRQFRGKRVWVVFSHVEEDFAVRAGYVKFYLELFGTRLDSFAAPGAHTELYDLSAEKPCQLKHIPDTTADWRDLSTIVYAQVGGHADL